MTTSLEINGCKCMNQHHFTDAEKLIGRPCHTTNTMTAFYDKEAEVVTLRCFWCDYKAEVDVAIRPLQLKQFSGKYITIGPPAK